jgi:hypothetical protein
MNTFSLSKPLTASDIDIIFPYRGTKFQNVLKSELLNTQQSHKGKIIYKPAGMLSSVTPTSARYALKYLPLNWNVGFTVSTDGYIQKFMTANKETPGVKQMKIGDGFFILNVNKIYIGNIADPTDGKMITVSEEGGNTKFTDETGAQVYLYVDQRSPAPTGGKRKTQHKKRRAKRNRKTRK